MASHIQRAPLIKPKPELAWRKPLSPANAASRGASRAGIKRSNPRNRRVQLSYTVWAEVGKPKVATTENGRRMMVKAIKKSTRA